MQRYSLFLGGLSLVGLICGCTATGSHPSAQQTHMASSAGLQKSDPVQKLSTPLPIEPTGGKHMPSATQLFRLQSSAFEPNQPIPVKYTCDGNNISPPLSLGNLAQGTQSLALIMDDPDAPGGTFTHWLLWNIPAKPQNIAEGQAPVGAQIGFNSFSQEGYGGPCPPSGTHRYRFKLYALDEKLDLPSGSDIKELQRAMQGHVLAETILTALYTRHRK